jgi:hypothetical protein
MKSMPRSGDAYQHYLEGLVELVGLFLAMILHTVLLVLPYGISLPINELIRWASNIRAKD